MFFICAGGFRRALKIITFARCSRPLHSFGTSPFLKVPNLDEEELRLLHSHDDRRNVMLFVAHFNFASSPDRVGRF
jgi:hypothetical protein